MSKTKPLSKDDKAILKYADRMNAFVDRYLFVCETLNLNPNVSRLLFQNPKKVDQAFKRIIRAAR